MSTLAEVRSALAATLGTLAAGDVKSLKVFDRPPSSINALPAVYLGGRTGRRNSQDEGGEVSFPVVVVCSTGDNPAGHDMIDRFVDGDLSIVDHLNGNRSLGTDDMTATTTGEWSDVMLEVGGVAHLCAEFVVEVQY